MERAIIILGMAIIVLLTLTFVVRYILLKTNKEFATIDKDDIKLCIIWYAYIISFATITIIKISNNTIKCKKYKVDKTIIEEKHTDKEITRDTTYIITYQKK